MAIDPRHAEAKADAKPDTAQADAAEANREEPVKGWTFADIGRRYSAADDIDQVSVEFWAALGMDKFCDPLVQMARLVTHAHALNLFHLKGEKGDAEKAGMLADAMGTNVDTLYRIIDQAVDTWRPMESKIQIGLKGEYAHAVCEQEEDLDLPFDPDPKAHDRHGYEEGDELDVDATIKAVDKVLEKEEEGEIDSK